MADSNRQLYQTIANLLYEHYGYPEWRQHLPAIDELVSTILSQSTSDTNRDKGFYALKARYPTWEAVRDAPVEEIIDTIRSAGLAQQKGPRIKQALQYVSDAVGTLSLEFLKDMPTDEAKAWLTRIDGVGPKTAAIILLFSFNKPAFPVDTHVHRVTGRLGLIDEKTSADKAHAILEAMATPENFYPDHLNLIRHGREICKALNPKCEECFLTAHCRYYQRLVSMEAAQ
jgi:endonuclease III